MNERFKYEKRYWYPHLKPNDIVIWERFIDENPDFFDEIMYDCAVGEGAVIPEGTDPKIGAGFKTLTQYKIDVVGFVGGKVYIIEVKPNAGTSALGQSLSYAALYKKYVDPGANVVPVVLTDVLRPDMPTLAESLGVKIYIA